MSPRPDPLSVETVEGIDNGGGIGGSPLDVLLQTPPQSPAARVDCTIVKPKMGGVYQHVPPAGEWVAWTGGKPCLIGLDLNRTGKLSPL
jgi:hypothetical protein